MKMPVEAGIAVVGLACRFPGSPDADSFWALLSQGRHAIGPIPSDRWSAQADAGSGHVNAAGLIENVGHFDAGFFGIAPREAKEMDPQQRILLEVTWDALEAAGETRERLQGSRTGVYVGISSVDYARIRPSDARLGIYSATGSAHSLAANRLSYVLDLRGPSVAVDTACSSSLVAVHLACRALRTREIDRALVGGVNLILSPDLMVVFSAARMLAMDGRCKTFDASADGYVRGEGCGMVVLKRLPDALEQRDPIIAIVRGSAVNQDGRSNGLTAPNGTAQQAVIEQAWVDAGLAGGIIDAIELHGTGTALGDPIEALALGTVLSTQRADDRMCQVGSVKTNIGHLEAAAGIAGLIKAALALRHGVLPPSLNFEQPNPEIPLPALGLAVATSPVALPDAARIGVSSFGFGGTNAHVVLQRAKPIRRPREAAREGPWVLPVSAHTTEALRDLCARYAERIVVLPSEALRDVVYTASVRRTHHDHRLAAIGSNAAELAQCLARFAAGESAGVHCGRRLPAGPGKIALWLGVIQQTGCRQIHAAMRWSASLRSHRESLRPAFAANALQLDSLLTDAIAPELGPVQAVAQLALLALEVRSWGIPFTVVAGTGAGAEVAAWCRGERSLDEALAAALDGARETQPPVVPERSQLVTIGDATLVANAIAATIEAGAPECLARAQAQLYVAGHALDWDAIQPLGQVVPLPAYPWQRQHYWFERSTAKPGNADVGRPLEAGEPRATELDAAAPWVAAPATHGDHILERLDAICAAFGREALIDLGWGPNDPPGDLLTLIERCRIAPGRVAPFRRLLERLANFGVLRCEAGSYAFGRVVVGPALEALDALRAAEPQVATELALLRRSARSLAAVLCGNVDPLALLFPNGDVFELRRLYGETPTARQAHRLLVERARAAVAARHQARPIRIIEIGAGTGGTTAALLHGFSDTEVEYVFTDVSDRFLVAAARNFGSSVTCRRLDIERPPDEQGFTASHDVVIASNVLHATRSLRDSVENCTRLLVPGGIVMLIESTRSSWPLELTFGLTDGWWRFKDHDIRPEQPLIGTAAWVDLLRTAGLRGCHAVPCDSRGQQSVITGVLGGCVRQPRWLLVGGGRSIGPALAQAIHDHGGLVVGDLADTPPSAAEDADRDCEHVVDLTPLSDEEGTDVPSAAVPALTRATLWTVARADGTSGATPRTAIPATPANAPKRRHIRLDDAPRERAALAILCAIEAYGASSEIEIRAGRILLPRAHAFSFGLLDLRDTQAARDDDRDASGTHEPVDVSRTNLAILLADAFPTERPALLTARLIALAATILQLPPDALDAERGLQDQGMDSLMALEFRAQLQRLTSLRLRATLALERPSIRSLTEYLLPLLMQAAAGRRQPEARSRYLVAPAGEMRQVNDLVKVDLPSLLASIAELPDEEACRRLLALGQAK
jgi:3-oxoacyl-(acyl-carrier-protein) synthase/SAM-dependent methyltransferase